MKITILSIFYLIVSVHTAWPQIESMKVHGSGDVHYLGFIKVFDAELYTSDPTNGSGILDNSVSKCLKLTYSIPLSAKDFIEGANSVLQRQHEPSDLTTIYDYIEQLHAAYTDVEKGDSYILCYDADAGTTTLSLNKKILTTIASRAFSGIYFGIWLGENAPLQKTLRDELLATDKS